MTFIGSGWDSTLIWTDQPTWLFMRARNTSLRDICFEHLATQSAVILAFTLFGPPTDLYVNHCKFKGTCHSCAILGDANATEIIENCVFDSLSAYDKSFHGPLGVFRNNICAPTSHVLTSLFIDSDKIVVENNFFYNVSRWGGNRLLCNAEHIDTLIMQNNICLYFGETAMIENVSRGSKFAYNIVNSHRPGLSLAKYSNDSTDYIDIYGNVFMNIENGTAIDIYPYSPYYEYASIRYNCFWNNGIDIYSESPAQYDSIGNIFVEPMFISSNDYHLQAFSPCINAGDPEILDLDSTRSDIGIYGGPLGEVYEYQDLPPGIPDSLYGSIANDTITVQWLYNTEADFNYYLLYRDTVSGFEPSVFNLIAEPETSLYIDTDFEHTNNYYYRISAIDNQDNVSDYSEELAVILTDIRDLFGSDVPRLTSIIGNYPNPFNSQTIIRYNIGNIGPMPVDVKIEIYDLLGRVVRILTENNRYPGEQEVVWDGRDNQGGELSSGVYFVKIKQWEGLIESRPRKIVLLK
ncbi:MAG: T9SS type A sorting domain-containing protein [candidate division Zixibacteria bacterium]|nr:T9SS type A sorting domain-containing protein [candidate division Zixibacteria bacterium]